MADAAKIFMAVVPCKKPVWQLGKPPILPSVPKLVMHIITFLYVKISEEAMTTDEFAKGHA
jgi:hypothetical protein